MLQAAAGRDAKLAGLSATVAREGRWVEFTSSEELPIRAGEVMDQVNRLKDHVSDGNLDLRITSMLFESGAELTGLVTDLKMGIVPGEVIQ